MDNKKIFMGIWLIILFVIILLSIKISQKKEEAVKESETNATLVTNYSTFFTVNNCANKYVNYLVNKDQNNLYKLIDETYIKDNQITENNILTKIKTLDGIYTFTARKMYYLKNDNLTKYYLYGYLNQEVMDSYVSPEDYYLIITIDSDNNLFSVTPYDGSIFKEAKNG